MDICWSAIRLVNQSQAGHRMTIWPCMFDQLALELEIDQLLLIAMYPFQTNCISMFSCQSGWETVCHSLTVKLLGIWGKPNSHITHPNLHILSNIGVRSICCGMLFFHACTKGTTFALWSTWSCTWNICWAGLQTYCGGTWTCDLSSMKKCLNITWPRVLFKYIDIVLYLFGHAGTGSESWIYVCQRLASKQWR